MSNFQYVKNTALMLITNRISKFVWLCIVYYQYSVFFMYTIVNISVPSSLSRVFSPRFHPVGDWNSKVELKSS